jgi:predicted permease
MNVSAFTETLSKDLRYALRQFVRNPVFTCVAVLSLAIGIGANTAIFSIMDSVLLKSLPVHNPKELVALSNPDSSGVSVGMSGGERDLITYAEFIQLRDHSTSFSGMCAAESQLDRWQVHISGGPQEDTRGRLVSEEYFNVLGVDPAIGRFFSKDDARGVGQDAYAVISYDYWQRRFAGNTSVLGTPVRIYGTTLTVIGVAAPDFHGESVADRPDMWVPMMMQPLMMPGRDWLHEDLSQNLEKVMWLQVFGRLKPGVSRQQAQSEVDVLFRGIIETGYPATLAPDVRKQALDQHIKVHDAHTGAFGGRNNFAEQLLILLIVSGVVLLIACANVANLLLARATARSKEVGVRLSIGASRLRLIRQFLTEAVLLSVIGGMAGLLLAWGGARFLVFLFNSGRRDFDMSPGLDPTVLGFTVGITLLTGIIFGLVPAIRGTRVNLNQTLRESGRGSTSSGAKLNLAKGLVIVQVGLSLLVVIGAGLFLRTLWNLQSVDLGYPKERLLTLNVDGVTAGYKGEQLSNLWRELSDRIRVVPGVQGVSYSLNGLFAGSESADEIEVEGFKAQKDDEKFSRFDEVGPDYFATIGVALLRGRDIKLQDGAKAPHVCVINEAFAKRFFAGRDPLGHHVTQSFGEKHNVMEVIGVARNARDHNLNGEVPPRFFIPGDQGAEGPNEWSNFAIRTAGNPQQMQEAVRKAILALNPDLPITDGRTLVDSLDRTTAQPRLIARLCSTFGIIALLLAATGLYGVLSYGVAQRTNEIGIRMALGADRIRVISMILRETGLMIVIGVVVGIVLTAAATRLIAAKLYGLSALDPLTIITAGCILASVALIAGYIPAARAARVNPVTALRHE